MPRGQDTRNHSARIVDINAWKARNNPATQTGGGGKKPPKTPKTRTGGGGDGFYDWRAERDFNSTPYGGIRRPEAAKNYPEDRDYIDRNPANKTFIEKMYDKANETYDKYLWRKNEREKGNGY